MVNIELKGFKRLYGLDNLIDESKKQMAKQHVCYLPVNHLVPGKYQPRSHMDETSLHELAASIKAQGIIQPLIIRRLTEQRYEIIAGERRWRAAKLLDLENVPAIIRDVSDETALAFALIENIQRENLNPIDEALSLRRLKEEFLMTHEDIAIRVGRSRSTVTNLLRLLSLPQPIKDLLSTHQLEMGHARALLSLDESKRWQAAQLIVEKNMSVRQSEALVKKLKNEQALPAEKGNEPPKDALLLLSTAWASRVKLSFSAQGKGKITIQVSSQEEAREIIEKLNLL